MPKQKATFQPTVRPDWAGAMDYMSETEQSKIFQAILMFPSVDLPESAYWNKTIKPDLQNQYETFMNVCEKKAIGVRKRWENAKSIDKYTHVIDMNTNLQDKNSNEQDMLYTVKDKDKNKDEDKDNKGGVGEKRETIDENTPFKAGGQMWTMPLQFRKLAKKYWAESEIREIEIEHSCHEEPIELTINDLLTIKPPKPKKKSYGEQQKVKLTDEEYTKLEELYGNKLNKAIEKLDVYLASYNKKYASHYAVMRRGNWVYKEIFKDGNEQVVPDEPIPYEELIAQRGIKC